MGAARKSWAQEFLTGASEEDGRAPSAKDDDERLSVRQAIVVWLVAAALGWLVTVAVVYFAARVF